MFTIGTTIVIFYSYIAQKYRTHINVKWNYVYTYIIYIKILRDNPK